MLCLALWASKKENHPYRHVVDKFDGVVINTMDDFKFE